MADNGFIRLIYGLAKKYGIDTTGLEPHEVLEILKQRGLLKPYNSLADIPKKNMTK